MGTGLDQGQRDVLREKIKPLMVDARKAKPPACYNVTGQEKPDFWCEGEGCTLPSGRTGPVLLQTLVSIHLRPVMRARTASLTRHPLAGAAHRERFDLMRR